MKIEMCGDGGAGRRRSRAWIKAQGIACRGLDRLDHLGRRRQRRFVGVELGPALLIRRLLARRIRFEAPKGFLQEAFRHLRDQPDDDHRIGAHTRLASSKKVSIASRGLTFCSR
jgi:hypothetical protein